MFGSPPLSISPKSPRSVSVHARGEALLGLLERSFLQEMFALSRNTTCLEYVSMLRLTPGSCLPAARAAPGLSLVRCAAPWEQLGGFAWFKDTRKVLSFAFPPPIFPPDILCIQTGDPPVINMLLILFISPPPFNS